MTWREFNVFYARCVQYATRGAAVVMLPGTVDGERVTVGYAWSVSPQFQVVAHNPNARTRAHYLLYGAIETRRIFARDHGLVLA